VATTNMSIAAMSGRWLRRKLRQVGEGTFGCQGIHRVPIVGRPGRRDRQRQRRRNLCDAWTTVAGLTNTIASMTCGQIR
jgi:hypothetical protein